MKQCLDCNRDISDKGNRSVRCDICQEKHRATYKKKSDKLSHDIWNKKVGSTRYNKETYDWSKYVRGLAKSEIAELISSYRKRLFTAKGREKVVLWIRIKILYQHCYPGATSLTERGAPSLSNEVYSKDSNNMTNSKGNIPADNQTNDNGDYNYHQYDNDAYNDAYEQDKIEPGTERINWDKAKTGWTQYYDDGLVTLSPDVFFSEWKDDE